ncbi:hypothetical protein CLU79DRAFT_720771 [Phycomyces nitens]|nr:hypothetical protein CLU79DRAFT_720771 [Phycomyces nitens]
MFRGIYRGKHAHADDFALILQRARDAGVRKLIITGTNLAESEEAVEETSKADQDPVLYSTVGCHPTRCEEFDAYPSGPEGYYAALLKLATDKRDKIVAIGECGLDYDRLQFCPKDTQKRYFEMQFNLAEKTKLPMFLHNRNTNDDFYDILFFSHGVVHSFTGSLEEMKKLVELDLFIGINGCSLKTQENLDVVKEIPEDKLMIETDAPWCDIRSTHASFGHLNLIKEEMELYAPASKKKEKFEMGLAVKNRNEPCAIGLFIN